MLCDVEQKGKVTQTLFEITHVFEYSDVNDSGLPPLQASHDCSKASGRSPALFACTHLSFGPPGFQASHTTLGGLRAWPGFLMRIGMCFCISLRLSLRVIDSGHRERKDLSY